jgi:hypothetical protein
MLVVALARAANVLLPQLSLDRWLREYDRAFAIRIPIAGGVHQADKVVAQGLSLGNRHACPFLGQPANNVVEAGCQ